MIYNLELNDEDLSELYSLIKLHLDNEFIDKSFTSSKDNRKEKLYNLLNAIKATVSQDTLKALFEDYVKLKYLRDKDAKHYVKKNVLEKIDEAMKRKLTVEMNYYSMNSRELTRRRVDIYSKKKDCIIGYCHTRQTLRSFRIDRIVSVYPTKQQFDMPKENMPKSEVLEE